MIIKDMYEFMGEKRYINKVVLDLESDIDDMSWDENGIGKVNFISQVDIDNIINNKKISDKTLIECKKYLCTFNGNLFIPVKEQKDINNLLRLSGGFHDAYLKELEELDDGSLRVLFDGIWGCSIEVVFSGEVSYYNERNIDDEDEYWFDCSLLLENDYIIFGDGEIYSSGDLEYCSTWFKSKKMKYRVIPK